MPKKPLDGADEDVHDVPHQLFPYAAPLFDEENRLFLRRELVFDDEIYRFITLND